MAIATHLAHGTFAALMLLVVGCQSARTVAPAPASPAPATHIAAAAPDARRPNIIFIFTDDHASHAISAYGSKINKTPHIDRLANEGMLFRNAFCTNSICGPSRAVILTGKHSHLNGFRDNGQQFDGSQQTFPKLLQKAGYATAIIGKWHLKTEPTGFDHWQVLPGQGQYYNPDFLEPGGRKRHTGYVTDITTNMALDWIKDGRDKDKPFMLMFQHKAPHREWMPGPDHLTMYDDVDIPEPATLFDDYKGRASPAGKQEMTIRDHLWLHYDLKVEATEEEAKHLKGADKWSIGRANRFTPEQREKWFAAYRPKNEAFRKANLQGDDLVRWKYQRYIKDYLRCVASVDDNIGRMLDYLDESGLAENTIVIYSSDQGFYLGDHGWYDKRWMYEQSLRMPLIVRWPGVTKPGSEDTHLVQNLDFAQTFLDMAGVGQPADMQGSSLVPLLTGEKPDDWRDAIYYHYYEYPAVHMVHRHYGVRDSRYKLISYYDIGEWELFDLHSDPDELKSIYDSDKPEHVAARERLKKKLKELQAHYKETDPDASREKLREQDLGRQAARTPLQQVVNLQRTNFNVVDNLDPSGKPLTVGAKIESFARDGVIAAHGGANAGYALYLRNGVPHFAVRSDGQLVKVAGPNALPTIQQAHIAGVLTAGGQLKLFVNGNMVATANGRLIAKKPAETFNVGRDAGSLVGDYPNELRFDGDIEHLRLYWGELDAGSIRQWAGL